MTLVRSIFPFCLGFLAFVVLSATSLAGNVQYEYDDLGRLTAVVYDDGARIDYSYDNAGNRTARIVSTSGPLLIADLRLSAVSAPNPPITVGQNLTFTVSVTNDGPAVATGILLQALLPPAFSLVSANSFDGTCDATVTCQLDALGPGSSASVAIEVTATQDGTVSYPFSVSASQQDPDTANNSTSKETTVLIGPDLAVQVAHSPPSATAGDNVSYSVVVSNNGAVTANNIVVDATLPDGVTYLLAGTTTGSCDLAVVCSIGTLASGETATITLDTNAIVVGPLSYPFSVSSDLPDANPSDNAVTDILTLSAGAADIVLGPNEPDGGEYGNNFGSDAHEEVYIVNFEGVESDMTLFVTGFDIDTGTEVAARLNGQLLGHLSVSANQSLNGGNTFLVPATMQVPGTNQVRFVQKSPGNIWGITDIRLVPHWTFGDVSLTLGLTDPGAYGKGHGTGLHFEELPAVFESNGNDVELSVTGFDIDLATEVAVWINSTQLGYLVQSPANATLNAGDVFQISSSLLLPGSNQIRFVQKTPGNRWGVQDIRVSENAATGDVALTLGITDPGAYGKGHGTGLHVEELPVVFESNGNDVELSVTGFDIDLATEVAVWINSTQLGYLVQSPANATLNAGDVFQISSSLLLPGSNQIRFVQKTPGNRWGAQDIRVSENSATGDVALTFGITDSGAYGKGFGSGVHLEGFDAVFESNGNDVVLTATGFDIDSANEVAVWVNGTQLGFLEVSPANAVLNNGDIFQIPASLQLSGSNQVRFVQKSPGFRWGVQDIRVVEKF